MPVRMDQISTIKDLIDLWPTRKDLAGDLGTSLDRVHKWAASGCIPARYHAGVLRAATHRGFVVTADDLVRLHDQEDAA